MGDGRGKEGGEGGVRGGGVASVQTPQAATPLGLAFSRAAATN